MAKTLVYQLYPIAWESRGGLQAMTNHLDIIKYLGADYVWLSPLYPSPRFDHGYDVSDYSEIDKRFGTMKDFDAFVKKAHSLGIGVLMDLVLNHTSTEHSWFKDYPECYCWSDTDRPGWHNLFDNGSAWQYDEERGKYYLHLFHQNQADLNWFPNGKLNLDLVAMFQTIVRYWNGLHEVDGFRLDVPQVINKDLTKDQLDLDDLLVGEQAVKVINAVFRGKYGKKLFLMMECLDPSYGEITKYYTDRTPINFATDMLLKDDAPPVIGRLTQNPQFMLDLESHDSPRYMSRYSSFKPFCPDSNYDPIGVMLDDCFRHYGLKAFCLYQGQELGLVNPSKEELSDEEMLALDAKTAMQAKRGESLEELRKTSRANGRIPLPMDEYDKQLQNPESCLRRMRDTIKRWKIDPRFVSYDYHLSVDNWV